MNPGNRPQRAVATSQLTIAALLGGYAGPVRSGTQIPRNRFAGLLAAPLAGELIESPAASLVVAERTASRAAIDPPEYIAPLHIHHDDDEAWYVLDGALGVRLGDENVEVPAGGAILVPRGTPHTYWNAFSLETRYLLIMTPRIRHLIDALHHPSASDPLVHQAIFRRHHSTLIGWPER